MELYNVIGLMSGTSLDGIDVSLIKTNGKTIKDRGKNYFLAYDQHFSQRIKQLFHGETKVELLLDVEKELTTLHARAVREFLANFSINKKEIDLIGFHGQTLYHDPNNGITCQIGNAFVLAKMLQINVVSEFRKKDVANGGQGAPLVPIYHLSLAKEISSGGRNKAQYPIVFLNIGGVANLTYIENSNEDGLIAFDTGPGNAIVDDIIASNKDLGLSYDKDGKLSSLGFVHKKSLDTLLADDYFNLKYPKSLDRNHFHYIFGLDMFKGLSFLDKLATATAFSAASVVKSMTLLPKKPKIIILCGGGRKNTTISRYIGEVSGIPARSINEYNIDGDFVESEAMAFLAARSMLNKNISFPKTTGVLNAMTGGVLYSAAP